MYSRRRGSRQIEHIGSAHDDVEVELLKKVARQRIAGRQSELDLGLVAPPEAGGPLPIRASRMLHLWDALSQVYEILGFDAAAGGDEVFECLVLARIVEPASKFDSLRVLEESGSGRRRMRRSNAACPRMPPQRGGSGWRRYVPTMSAWDRLAKRVIPTHVLP